MALNAFAATPATINLSDGWTVNPVDEPATVYQASVPSTAMGVLMNAGALPANLLDGMNYKNFDGSRFAKPWRWSTVFALPQLDENDRVTLELDGISYRADVLVNGKRVASADTLCGPFRQYKIDITPVVAKDNKLEIIVTGAKPGEPNIGFVDWNPKPADGSMGIFRPVRVRVTGGVVITNAAVKSRVDTSTLDKATLTVEATLTNKTPKVVSGKLCGEFEGGKFSRKVKLQPNSAQVVSLTDRECKALRVKNPRLWWPNGMGSPEMYDMRLDFVAYGADEASDCVDIHFGIRQLEDYYTSDNQRGFKINGKPVLVRSAGWTDDIFLRNDSLRYATETEYVRQMGLNSIRFENIWGTSGYVYDMCDRLGLLALVGWSCQWEWEHYLGSPIDKFGGIKSEEDMDLIAASLGDQVAWLRNHPSIIAWFTGSDRLPRPELEKRYLDVLARLDDRPYFGAAKQIKSEVTGYTGTKMAGPYEYVAPNYWYEEKAPGGAFGFNTETGIGAQVPQKESVIRMLEGKVWPLGDEWDYHCTTASDGMHSMKVLSDAIAKRYGAAADFDDFMRKAEWVNYDGTRTMFEAFRARVPRATGIVQWMLNSAWPSTYWQLYDHYLVPTSAYYSLRRSNAPVQLIYDYGKKTVVLVNESGDDVQVNARMELFGLADSYPRVETAAVTGRFYEPTPVFSVADPEALEFVFLTLEDADGNVIAENFYVLPPEQDVSDWEHGNWFVTPVARHADMTALGNLPQATVGTSVRQDGDTLTVSLENKGASVAFFTRLAALGDDGMLIVPAYWSDNYFSLRPGEKKTVSCRLPSERAASAARLSLEGWNIAPAEIVR